MIRMSIVAILAASLLLAACETNDASSGEKVGTHGGAAGGGGGLIGSQINKGNVNATATLGGAMDDADRKRATAAAQRAETAPIGQQVTWSNPQNGDSGTITPLRDGYAANGTYCREFQQMITVGGQQQQTYGKSCQQPDGGWKIVQ